jgi:hypothetical protein
VLFSETSEAIDFAISNGAGFGRPATAQKMPFGGRLPDEQVTAFEKWITLGAPWPENDRSASAGPKAPGFYERIRKEHWAFQPVRDIKPEEIAGIEHPVDRFLVSTLPREGLQSAAQADRRTLVRRLSFVLTGLPPTPLEVDPVWSKYQATRE